MVYSMSPNCLYKEEEKIIFQPSYSYFHYTK